jgi:DNA repair protein RadA/Sms
LQEELLPDQSSSSKFFKNRSGMEFAEVDLAPAISLAQVEIDESLRYLTGIHLLDEILGGGLVSGSVVLLAGDPGVGKSTLLLQVADVLSRKRKVLYVSGEESRQQIKIRADRLSLSGKNLLIDSLQNIDSIESHVRKDSPQVLVIDSIQSVYSAQFSSACGSVTQVRECCASLVNMAKSMNISVIIVGHVTKDGSIAGPRVLEHMVDVVLNFEGDRHGQLRVLRSLKNRFGSTNDIAVFAMKEEGLSEVDNPSVLFLSERLSSIDRRAASGTSIIASLEGKQVLLLEVQALVGYSHMANPRRLANGWDYNRLLQVLAILEKKIGLLLSKSDVYLNIVGGFTCGDPSADLGVAASVATSLLDRSIDPGLLLVGEIGLTGEVRPVADLKKRLKEAAKLGFKKAVVPKANLGKEKFKELEVIGVESLMDALKVVIPSYDFDRKPKLDSLTV